MRSVLFIGLSLLLCSYNGYKKCETCTTSDMKGRIAFLTEIIVTGDKDAPAGKYEFDRKVYHYDKKGRLKWRSDSTYVYDKITKRGVSNVYVELYSYKKGRLHRLKSGPDRSPVIQEFAYDKQGRQTMIGQYTLVAGTKTIRTDREVTTVFAADGHSAEITRKALKSGEMKVISGEKEEYDNMGRIIRSLRHDVSTGKYLITNEYTYDAAGNTIQQKMYNTFNGDLQSNTKYLYDEQGRLDREVKTMASGTIHTTTYTYSVPDKQGNYLKVIASTDGGSFVTTRRVILYY